ncbi:uncharacterized protein KZ484_019093 isoform 1-T1 [Pholidichthys leucotaenia]
MILSLVLIWAEAQNLTEVKGQLGKDVTLNCSFNDSEVHWYLQIYGQFKGEIGRSLASDSIYSSTDFKTKFSILRNRLVIKNVTAEDCRLYFCGRKKKAEFHLVDTFSLTLNSSQSSNSIHHSSWRMWEPFIYPSFGLNAILVVAVMGLICTLISVMRKKKVSLSPETPETIEIPQYEEIHFSPEPAAPLPDCIYCKAQLPASMLLPDRNT